MRVFVANGRLPRPSTIQVFITSQKPPFEAVMSFVTIARFNAVLKYHYFSTVYWRSNWQTRGEYLK